MAAAGDIDAELLDALMGRFAANEERLAKLEQADAEHRENTRMLARHLRVACDAVASAAELVEQISQSAPADGG